MSTVAEIVTNTIIKKMEEGQIPWLKPWTGGEAVNYVTQKPYRGVNRWLLDGGEYLTFKQIQELKGTIKKGAKSHIVVFYKSLDITDDETDEVKQIKLLRYYRVFSLADVEGIESKQTPTEKKNFDIDECEKVVDDYITASGVTLKRITSIRAYYNPVEDLIVIPSNEQFKSSEHRYATLFHEMAHSTGHINRLNRLTKTAHFGNEDYSREELVAELTSAMLCKHTGIDSAEIMINATGYLQGWLHALKNDANMLFVASAKAEKAFNYILDGAE